MDNTVTIAMPIESARQLRDLLAAQTIRIGDPGADVIVRIASAGLAALDTAIERQPPCEPLEETPPATI